MLVTSCLKWLQLTPSMNRHTLPYQKYPQIVGHFKIQCLLNIYGAAHAGKDVLQLHATWHYTELLCQVVVYINIHSQTR